MRLQILILTLITITLHGQNLKTYNPFNDDLTGSISTYSSINGYFFEEKVLGSDSTRIFSLDPNFQIAKTLIIPFHAIKSFGISKNIGVIHYTKQNSSYIVDTYNSQLEQVSSTSLDLKLPDTLSYGLRGAFFNPQDKNLYLTFRHLDKVNFNHKLWVVILNENFVHIKTEEILIENTLDYAGEIFSKDSIIYLFGRELAVLDTELKVLWKTTTPENQPGIVNERPEIINNDALNSVCFSENGVITNRLQIVDSAYVLNGQIKREISYRDLINKYDKHGNNIQSRANKFPTNEYLNIWLPKFGQFSNKAPIVGSRTNFGQNPKQSDFVYGTINLDNLEYKGLNYYGKQNETFETMGNSWLQENCEWVITNQIQDIQSGESIEDRVYKVNCQFTNLQRPDNNKTFSVYPIPFINSLKVEFPRYWTGKISLMDTQGKLVYQGNLSNVNSSKIDVSQLAPGIYLLKAQDCFGNATSQRVVKK
ncbi:T9SS type A sorting domain-containing protein [Luteibaculum oceani]|uniref:T9SS type A sorting domain-containing protein n=1 Tax=Luteibaculum oceani TaxID=1294296 RepID=A0A5C6VKI4_9FLAO|nr:T9SS type A sorting domain-containing protein [Luteibaculum oceani]TXC85211.1 T9SS type A sorting domain-containing protein [Luteibaculum oceani]